MNIKIPIKNDVEKSIREYEERERAEQDGTLLKQG
jgi:hypothetical protein